MLSVTATTKTLPVLPGAVAPDRERILFALNERERSVIFPVRNGNISDLGHCKWLSADRLPEGDWVRLLQEFRPTILVSCWSTPMLPASLLFTDALPLRYLCHTTGSVKGTVPRDFIAGGGIVTNWGNLVSHDVAEHALLLILGSLKSLPRWKSAVENNHDEWGSGQALNTRSLRGKTVGLHGFGGIACELIQLLKPFGVRCLAFSQNVPHAYIEKRGATPCLDLKELFMKSDIVVECEALTPESVGMVTEEHFQLMRRDSVFVNVARGAIVDEAALARFAARGHIRVASDVFQSEPPRPDVSGLRSTPGVIVSPHIGGPTGDSYPRCGEIALDNINRYLEGQPLEGVVTLEIFDRST